MKILITICARGGSKGVPGKNIKVLNGLPLIAYSIKAAKSFLKNREGIIELSTDSVEIKKVAAKHGLSSSYTRPEYLALDSTGKVEVIYELLRYAEDVNGSRFDYVLDLDVTSPLRTEEDLNKALDMINSNEEALNLFSVNPSNRNPYFNMVESREDGYVQLVKAQKDYRSRQETPEVYDINGSFYFYKRAFFETLRPSVITDKSMVYIMPHPCFDIDHPIDFRLMEFMMKESIVEIPR